MCTDTHLVPSFARYLHRVSCYPALGYSIVTTAYLTTLHTPLMLSSVPDLGIRLYILYAPRKIQNPVQPFWRCTQHGEAMAQCRNFLANKRTLDVVIGPAVAGKAFETWALDGPTLRAHSMALSYNHHRIPPKNPQIYTRHHVFRNKDPRNPRGGAYRSCTHHNLAEFLLQSHLATLLKSSVSAHCIEPSRDKAWANQQMCFSATAAITVTLPRRPPTGISSRAWKGLCCRTKLQTVTGSASVSGTPNRHDQSALPQRHIKVKIDAILGRPTTPDSPLSSSPPEQPSSKTNVSTFAATLLEALVLVHCCSPHWLQVTTRSSSYVMTPPIF